MPAKESTYSSADDEPDASAVAIQAQQRILKLKAQRDERSSTVVRETSEALDELRAKFAAQNDEHRKQEVEAKAAAIAKLIEVVERRRHLEAQIERVVARTNERVKHVEDIMMTGYKGRERDTRQVLEGTGQKRNAG